MSDDRRRKDTGGAGFAASPVAEAEAAARGGPLEAKREPPVVARLLVEIRSDGSHTIARGAAEDMNTGERVSIEAEGATPLGLALSLLKSALELPALARTFARGLLPPSKK